MRTCLFCGQKPSTREDAWPKWLMTRFPLPDTARMFAERGGKELPDWPLTKPMLVVKRLCGSCNNSWMSKLESTAKPIIESILDDTLTSIDAPGQVTLSTWAIKTAMVLEAFDPGQPWFYSADERDFMRRSHTFPDGTSVWIAKCVNQPNIYSAKMIHSTEPGPDGARAVSVTMAFGSLAIQVVTTKANRNNATVGYDVSKGRWQETLVQIQPASQDSKPWPGKFGLDGDRGLIALTERLDPNSKWS